MDRYPEDFMFQPARKEFDDLKSQIATSSREGKRKLPFAYNYKSHGNNRKTKSITKRFDLSGNKSLYFVFY